MEVWREEGLWTDCSTGWIIWHAKERKLVHSIEQSLASSTLRWAHTVFLASLSSLGCLASSCSAALRSWVRWRSVASLVCLAAGCSAALRTRRLSTEPSLPYLGLLWSSSLLVSLAPTLLAVALSSRSRRNLNCLTRVENRIRSFNLNFRYMASQTGHTYTRILQ